ncbi:DUF445 domain-containing protein [Lysinibacillus fusiformis]|uniref:DUF445 domain-containing protein n=1 Tax=Lysinibacillus fusiformis TaxID=28031 RepID=UPI0008923559|nr:DUF445 family protein [Lysinibacillus fusiformis]SCX68910.1 Uncharacterized membrane protein YheB, UPF0754 family [Lysinibacillus fusiformis]SDB42106.1 Uncharacterized membrane protein YheB, UPF0754 family [Lysinibacillus fusiformis]SFI58421.1 Uncharacterized membrane protein YheB, UPF0754 family [Lysinibacillus fusiformis]SFT28255.1 Uncharacterized membrane protein YheB, UPF0754 family [Lysinibacillus fusiformis]
MDNFLVILLFMAIIGAAIGGVTNHLAIKMLFRPHNAIYIKNWRVPFTPGLIPKRRDELAKQLGLTVVNYLLTPETFRKKFFSKDIQEKVEQFVQTKVEETIFTNDKTIQDWLNIAGFAHMPATIEQKVEAIVEGQFASVKNTLSTKSIRTLLSSDMQDTLDAKIPVAVSHILEKGEDYFLSPEGEMTIKAMIDDFLSSKGSFGGMINMFLGDSSSLVGKVQRELVKFLQAPGTSTLLTKIFTQEWEKLKDRPAMDFLQDMQFHPILSKLQMYVKEQLAVAERLNQSISYYWPEGNEWMKNSVIPQAIEKAFVKAEEKLEDVLTRLNLQEVVREQVDSFPVEKLEELVLGISKREFKMITVLGAVLGGLIGIVQGLIVYFI